LNIFLFSIVPATNKCKENPCPYGQRCHFTGPGTFECKCPKGYKLNGIECMGNYVKLNQNRFNFYFLLPFPDINECLDPNKARSCRFHTRCLNTIGSYQCVCEQGYVNVGSVTSKIHKCIGINDLIKCRKPTFLYRINHSDENECLNPLRWFCPQGKHCVNDPGSYHCECDKGFLAESSLSTAACIGNDALLKLCLKFKELDIL